MRVMHVPTGVEETVDPIGKTMPDEVAEDIIRRMSPTVPAWVPWPSRLSSVLRGLIELAKSEDGERGELARTHDALPVAPDLWSWVLLRDDGVVVTVTERNEPLDLDAQVEHRADPPYAARVVAIAARRFPELADAAPTPPDDADPCKLCSGAGQLKGDSGCPACGGTGSIYALQLPLNPAST